MIDALLKLIETLREPFGYDFMLQAFGVGALVAAVGAVLSSVYLISKPAAAPPSVTSRGAAKLPPAGSAVGDDPTSNS